ncbi:toll/interleukin-1 receptor domain-containing protein [bacterium]|nr:toll/interleukin-1 receptor domain-containing protein [bacterium]
MQGLLLFLSYSRRDQRVAERLCDELAGHGIRVWKDDRNLFAGDDLRSRLRHAIHVCHGHLVLLSQNSIRKSTWVLLELGAAWYAGKRIYPLRYRIRLSSVPVFLRNDVLCDVGQVRTSLLPALSRLAEELDLEASPQHHIDLQRLSSSAIKRAGAERMTQELRPLVSGALSGDISLRRKAHIEVRDAGDDIRAPFLDAMEVLVGHSHPAIRGEAYYCLGRVPLNSGHWRHAEAYFLKGLFDPSWFVRACCANVLRHRAPLSPDTVSELDRLLKVTLSDEGLLRGPGLQQAHEPENTFALPRFVYYAYLALDAHHGVS